ncbi:MAG: competence/damage-inducible protein A [Candidatus Eremiobacteraeota bacterium]|nr:competence/damage-inducible protein A [Candidatus Eremiobacteraeota bacterium]
MKAEILVVGSELLSPLKIDTNSLWLTEQLNELGIEVTCKIVVGDDLGDLTAAFRLALERSGLVLSTGGLGPTLDDLTRDAVSAATGRELVCDESIVDYIRGRFAARGREMADNNRRQAMVPEGAQVMDNPNGTAPGLRLLHNGVKLAVMPGPPREMKAMFTNHVRPWLEESAGALRVMRKVLYVTGMGESDMDALIGPIYSQTDNPSTTINFTATDLEIHLTARGASLEEASARIEELVAQFLPKLGSKCYSTDGRNLEQVVGHELAGRGLTVATAESLTGGLIGERITRVAGSSAYFVGGFTTYTDQMKQQLLGIPADLLDTHGAVSAPVAEAMAARARHLTGADLAVSATGFAGPDGGTPDDPVGTVYIGVAGAQGAKVRRLSLPGDRELVRMRAAQGALFLLRKTLLAHVPA